LVGEGKVGEELEEAEGYLLVALVGLRWPVRGSPA
jgi:hypothetical protein